jgi:hypothetical protein
MKWICTLDSSRVFQAVPITYVQSMYDRIYSICGLANVQQVYRVTVFHRHGSRKVVDMFLLTDELKRRNISFREINDFELKTMDQCEIFRLYQQSAVIIGSYGSDLTYGMILRKALFPLMSSQTQESFYEVMRGVLGYSNPYKVVHLTPLNETSPGKVPWEERRIHNFLKQDMMLSKQIVEELVNLISIAV